MKPERLAMPVIRVEMLKGRSRGQKRELAARLTGEHTRICGAEAVYVVEDVDNENRAVGGRCSPTKLRN